MAPLESKKCLIFDTFKLSQERSIDWRSKFEKSSREKAFSRSGKRGQSRTRLVQMVSISGAREYSATRKCWKTEDEDQEDAFPRG